MTLFLVLCPHCKKNMKYEARNVPKSKQCVYCGRRFDAKRAILKRLS